MHGPQLHALDAQARRTPREAHPGLESEPAHETPVWADLDALAGTPRTPAHEAYWQLVTRTVADAVRSGAADDPLISSSLSELVTSAAIACFEEGAAGPGPLLKPATAAVRRACDYIDEHADEPVSLQQIAAAARLSQRGVQYAFRNQVGVSPMTYLRTVRLERAREQLREADPADGGRVRTAAVAAGFANTGRFAAAYRALFGENPSDTLRG